MNYASITVDMNHDDIRCERHPERAWPHAGCPYLTVEDTVRGLVWQREHLREGLRMVLNTLGGSFNGDDRACCIALAKEALEYRAEETS
jgi:hypothetical protein